MTDTVPAEGPSASAWLVTPPRSFAPDRAELRLLTERCRDLCYSAVKTLATLPDRERAWLGPLRSRGQPAPQLTVEDVWHDPEWGPESAIALERHLAEEQDRRAERYYRPTPEEVSRCIPVLGWLSWLEREANGRAERLIICARAFKVPFSKLARRFGRSDETISRWQDAGLRAIVGKFHAEVEAMR